MVKNPDAKEQGRILFHDIGDYLSREHKLKRIQELASVNGLTDAGLWQTVTPDEHGDWLRQRDDSFGKFIAIGSKEKDAGLVLFDLFSRGVETARDAWCFNSSRSTLETNIKTMISTYERERQQFNDAFPSLNRKEREKQLDGFVTSDPTRISWSVNLKQDVIRNKKITYETDDITTAIYRPFFRQYLYFNRDLNNRVYQMPRLFPDAKADNRMIMIKQRQPDNSQFALMSKYASDLQSDGGTQCFSEYSYEEDRTGQDRTGQDRTGQDRTGQDRTGQDRTGQDRTGQDRTGQDNYTRQITEVQEKNLVICISGSGEDRPFSTMMMSSNPDLHLLHGGQCFPMFLYETEDNQ